MNTYITLPNFQSQCDYHKAFSPGTYLHLTTKQGTYEYEQGIDTVTIVGLSNDNIKRIWDYLRFEYLRYQYQKTKSGTDLAFVDPSDIDFDDGDYFDIVPDVLSNILFMAYKISPETYGEWLKTIKEDKVMAHNYFSEGSQKGGFEPDDTLHYSKAETSVTVTEMFKILSMPRWDNPQH